MQPLCNIDLSGLSMLINDLVDALVAYGDVNADLPKTLKHQAGLLALDISDRFGPKNQQEGGVQILKDIQKTYSEIAVPVWTGAKRGKTDVQWMFGVPSLGYVVGVNPKDVMLELTTKDMNRGRAKERGPKWLELGTRKSQRFMRINRTIVKRGRIKELWNYKVKRIGRMKATFAYTARLCGQTRIPSWVTRHFDDVSSDGAAIFDQSKLSDQNPAIVFGGRAPGLHKHADVVNEAVENRSHRTAARIQRIIRAYSQAHARGERIKRQSTEE